MSRSAVSRSTAQSGVVRPIQEPENTRLQRDIFEYTIRLENEKRELENIEEQIKQVQTELSERNDLIEKMRPNQLTEKKDGIKINSNSHAVNQERLNLNQTKTENAELRKQIDVMRKQLTNVKSECNKLKSKTNNVKRECLTQNTEY